MAINRPFFATSAMLSSTCSAFVAQEWMWCLSFPDAGRNLSRSGKPIQWGQCACRLKMDQMEAVFDHRRRLLPRPSDLSYYNWDTQMSTSNASPNFQVGVSSML